MMGEAVPTKLAAQIKQSTDHPTHRWSTKSAWCRAGSLALVLAL